MFEQPRIEGDNQNQNIEGVNRDMRSKSLLRFLHASKNIHALHDNKLEEVFSDELNRREFIKSLQPGEFIELLNGINGILRKENKDKFGMVDGTVSLVGFVGTAYIAPRFEDKEELFTHVLDSAKEMNQNQRSLQDIALLVSASINAIHAYPDANGRTSRLVYSLLADGFDKDADERITEILGKYGSDKIDVNPGFVSYEINGMIDKRVGINDASKNPKNVVGFMMREEKDIVFGEDISESEQNIILDLFKKEFAVANNDNLFLATFQYLSNNNRLDKYLKQFPERCRLSMKLLAQELTSEDFKQIYANYRKLKNEYVDILIDLSLIHI